MKKILLFAITIIFIMMPGSAFAQKAIADDELDAVTGEQGVSINFDNVTVSNSSLATMAFGDSDGFTNYTSPAWFGANNIVITGTTAMINGEALIDVGSSGTTTAVNLVLPSLTMGPANITANLRLDSTQALSTTNTFLGVNMTELALGVAGTIRVYAH